MEVPAGKFKATCLKLMDRVATTGEEVVITKRGKPIARLAPVRSVVKAPRSIVGAMAGSALYVAPEAELLSTGERWDAEG